MSFFKQFFTAFYCCLFFVISMANSEENAEKWNEQKIKIEIIKMNDKFNFWGEEIDKLKDKMSNLVPQQQTVLFNLQEKNKILEASMADIKQQLEQLSSELNQSKKREDSLQQHIDNLHLMLGDLKKKNVALEKTVSLTKPHMYLRASHEYFYKEPDFTWKIPDIKSELNRTKLLALVSEVFPLKGYPFSAQAKLTLENNYFYCALSYKEVKKSGKPLALDIIPTVYYTVKNDAEDGSRDLIREINHLYPRAQLKYDQFNYRRNLTASTYNLNNTLTIAIHVEPPWVIQQAYSYDGSLVWAIEEYRKKREMGEKDLVRYHMCPYFYTGRRGYRVRANVWLNGFGAFERKGLTVRFYFLTGPNDKDLKESAIFKVTVTLIHPADPSQNIVKSSEQRAGNKEFRMDMGTHEEVEKVLNDDTLYYQVTVNPA